MTQRRAVTTQYVVYAILALAFGLRLAWAIAVPVRPFSDGHIYDLLAQNILNGNGFTLSPGEATAFWPPVCRLSIPRCFLFLGTRISPSLF